MHPLLTVLVLILDIVAITDILQDDAPSSRKLTWILLVLVLPFLGMILYFSVGKNQSAH
ncbi:MAG TPA: PLD nuclease N-terminal domain-containing protein [Phycisphaerae bacterium]|nr:PLD nuclease N-terminal domain-containing protein [Phycisphaerae bacterium]